MNKIIAIVGMCGSGKSIACEYLESKGFEKVYFGGVVIDKVKELNLEVNQQNERMVRENLREKLGMCALAKILLPVIRKKSLHGNVVLDGLYSWDEYKILQERFDNQIILVAVVTDKNIRCERLEKREYRPLTREEVIKRDITEIETLAKGGPIAFADYFVNNNGTEEELKRRIDEIINK